MPINIPRRPARQEASCSEERIFALEEDVVAERQEIRPLRVAIAQPHAHQDRDRDPDSAPHLQVAAAGARCDFMRVSTHMPPRHVSQDHLGEASTTRLTRLPTRTTTVLSSRVRRWSRWTFEDVDYWDELCGIIDWSRRSTCSPRMYLCWGAHGRALPALVPHPQEGHAWIQKLFGVFPAAPVRRVQLPHQRLRRGVHYMPHSRHAAIDDQRAGPPPRAARALGALRRGRSSAIIATAGPPRGLRRRATSSTAETRSARRVLARLPQGASPSACPSQLLPGRQPRRASRIFTLA